MYNNHSAINAEIMENQNKFQGLKNLHQNLHSRKGLTNINSADNAFCIDSKQTVYAGNNFPVDGQEMEGRERNPVNETNNLLKAVKSVYVDNNVELSQPKIFVGNISYKLSTSQLKEFFSGFGRVIYAQIVKDRVKKRSKGYGFVTFSNESEVQRVLEAEDDELILDGRTLRVNRAEKKRRSRPVRESNDENNPKKSLEEYVQKYMESVESPECDQFETDEENDHVYFSHLNDDILLYIFMFLTIKERVKIERVCKRWHNLATQTWLTVTHLDFKGVFISFPQALTDRILHSLFKKGCQNLKSLDLSHSSKLLTDYSLYLIGQNCPQLQEVNLSGVNVTMKSLKDMSSKCSKLKKIKLQRCYEVGEKALWWLFKQCTDLEYIDIGGNIRITGQCFFMLTEKCKTLMADDCMKLTDSGLQFITKRCSSLEELSISHCLTLTDAGITDIFKHCTNLRRFSFSDPPKREVTTQSLLALRYSTQLEELELAKHNSVNDNVLFVIGSNCTQLRLLNLEACHNVTDYGIQSLTACLQLHKLIISYLDKVTNDSVEAIAQNGTLRELTVRSCNITDRVVEQLALHCPHLQELDLSGSECIRNRSLDVLEEHMGDNKVMVITVGGTGITMERVSETQKRHPSWVVTTQDLSDHHLRVDFDPYMDMGPIIPEYSDSDEGPFQFDGDVDYDAEDYLTADDPAMWEYEEQWMS